MMRYFQWCSARIASRFIFFVLMLLSGLGFYYREFSREGDFSLVTFLFAIPLFLLGVISRVT
ncbi:MAG: hypothetical protein HYZ50_17525 [Deltaproteobacteria bacterium]|nr:hypothetical protein [Deltaproteobacteria bacterium]